MLGDVVSKCLHMAVKDNCFSIAFPAIGTGMLGFSKSEVAHIMTKAVQVFSSSYRGNCMDVHFVIYPSDEDTFQVLIYTIFVVVFVVHTGLEFGCNTSV